MSGIGSSSAGSGTAERAVEPSARNELRALGALMFDELSAFPGGIRDMHMGIAERAFRGAERGVGPMVAPIKAIHDTVSRRAYDSVGAGATRLGRLADAAMARRGIGDGLTLSGTPRGSAVIAALNGLIGDRLERTGSELHQPASIRHEGEIVASIPESLRTGFPTATPRLVVFLHGLMETEFSWRWSAVPASDTYGARLAGDLGYTPLYLRYNSGLHISENGRAVADLLEQTVRAWPVEVAEVALVGHSMGGLVARSACYQAAEREYQWTEHVRHVVSLGTPHLGAPLAQGVHVASAALHTLPETRMFASFLRRRSAGIRDLRYGSLVDEDWRDRDPDALRAVACKEVPLLEGATHCFISATITTSQHHPVGRLLGDTLVLVPSATGRGRTRRIPFEAEYGYHVSPAHHFALLNHPEVYERLRGWLEPAGASKGSPAPGQVSA